MNENDLVTDFVDAHPVRREDRSGDRLIVAENPQEQVFGVDVVMKESIRFFTRQSEDSIGFLAKAVLIGRWSLWPTGRV